MNVAPEILALGKQIVLSETAELPQFAPETALQVAQLLGDGFRHAGEYYGYLRGYEATHETLDDERTRQWAADALSSQLHVAQDLGVGHHQPYNHQLSVTADDYVQAIKAHLLAALEKVAAFLPAEGMNTAPIETWQEILVPPYEDIDKLMAQLFPGKNFFPQQSMRRKGPYDIIRDGVKVDFSLLKRFEERYEAAGLIAAAAQGRIQQALTDTHPGKKVYADKKKLTGHHSGRDDLHLGDAMRQGVSIMDLPTFLAFAATNATFRAMTHSVMLNHVLPDGQIAQASWSEGRLALNAEPYGGGYNWRVFPAI